MIPDNVVILQNFLVNGTLLLMFVILGTLLLKRRVTRLTVTLSLFFFTAAAGIALNITYRLLDDYYLNILLNKVAGVIAVYSLIFLYSFNRILLKSERVFTLKTQILISIIYLCILSGIFFIPNAVEWKYLTPEGYMTGYSAYLNRVDGDIGVPVWNLEIFLYYLISTQTVFVLTVITAVRIYRKMEKSIIKKKYLTAILGIFMNDAVLVGYFLVDIINTQTAWNAVFAISILVPISAILLFYGLGKQNIKNNRKRIETTVHIRQTE